MTLIVKIWVNIHTYNTYGGHQTLSLVGRFLGSGNPGFGDAVKEIDVHVYFKSAEGPRETLESLFDRYNGFIQGLPTTKFYRKKARFEINYLTELGDSRLVNYGPPNLDLFVAGAHELVAQSSSLKEKLKKSDDFSLDAFSLWLRQKLSALPKTADELIVLKEHLDAESKRERDAMDEWEKLAIDWEDYHPSARTTLDKPFFWDCTDDFAPNGNDTGADVLGLYATWRKRTKTSPAASFLSNLMRDWGVTESHPSADDTMNGIWEEAKIGLAFAQLKVDGQCEDSVRSDAIASIALCRSRMTANHPNWELLGERIRTLDLLENKLRQT